MGSGAGRFRLHGPTAERRRGGATARRTVGRGATIPAMKVRLLAFATAADALGDAEREIELPDGSTVAELRRHLEARHPELAALWPRLAIAVEGKLSGSEATIADGAEVALLPPVSGGCSQTLEATRTALVEEAIDVAGLVERLSRADCGAVVLFLGTVRDHHGGRRVVELTYTAYRQMAADKLKSIARELEATDPRLGVGIVHRLGTVPIGEPSVAIAVASPHRAAAYEASRRALERLKREVPIWKRERYDDGELVWREEEPLGESRDGSQAP